MDFTHNTTVTLVKPLGRHKVGAELILTRARLQHAGREVPLYKIPGVGFGVSFRALQGFLGTKTPRLVGKVMSTKGQYALHATMQGSTSISLATNEGVYHVCETVGTPEAQAFAATFRAAMLRVGLERLDRGAPPLTLVRTEPEKVAPVAEKPRQLDMWSGQAQAKPDHLAELLKVLPTLSEAAQVEYIRLLMSGQSEARRA